MSRRGVPKGGVGWYLREWMEFRGLSGRGAQAEMMKLTGWSKATMSQLYSGSQDYSPKLVNEAAVALKVEPFELLMHPDRAMALRDVHASAATIVKLHAKPPVLEPVPEGADDFWAAERNRKKPVDKRPTRRRE